MERFEEALEALDARVKLPERGYSTQYDKLCEMCRNIDLIEQELGIPLEVLFKALKEGVYIIDACEIIYLNHTEISLHHNGVQWLWETPYGAKIFTHYQITWALTREEMENESSK